MTISAKAITIFILAAAMLQGCATTNLDAPPPVLFKEGEESFNSGRYNIAIEKWKKVEQSYHSPELNIRAELGIADAYFLDKQYIEAAGKYEDFRKLHPTHDKAGYALYRQGLSNYNQTTGIDTDQTPVINARTVFESYLRQYPNGQNTAEAQEKIRDCRDRQLQYEIYVGRFYLRTDQYPSAIGRFEEAIKTFPDLPRRAEALFNLIRAYVKADQKTKADAPYATLQKDFAGNSYTLQAKDLLGK